MKEHKCFFFHCDNQWKVGHNGFYSCEEHEDIFFNEFISRDLLNGAN